MTSAAARPSRRWWPAREEDEVAAGRLQLRVHPAGLACLAGLVLAARLPALAPGAGPGFALLAALATALVVDAAWSLWVLRRRGLVVTAVAPADGTVGEPAPVRLSVRGRRAPLLVRISSVRAASWLRLDAPQVGEIETRPERRGEFRSIEVSLAHNAPLGLVGVMRTVSVTLAAPILVGPRPRPSDIGAPPSIRHEPAPTFDRTSVPSSEGELVRGARPYRSGDSPRRVHWPLTARTGELMVRELDGVERPRILIRVDLGPRPGPSAEAVAERAAGVVARLRAAGYPVSLLTREEQGPRVGPVDRGVEVGRRLALAVPGPATADADRSGAGPAALVIDPHGHHWRDRS